MTLPLMLQSLKWLWKFFLRSVYCGGLRRAGRPFCWDTSSKRKESWSHFTQTHSNHHSSWSTWGHFRWVTVTHQDPMCCNHFITDKAMNHDNSLSNCTFSDPSEVVPCDGIHFWWWPLYPGEPEGASSRWLGQILLGWAGLRPGVPSRASNHIPRH